MGHHHNKKGHGIHGHHPVHHAMPSEVQPVPEDVRSGISFTAEAIIAATSKRCKLLGQGGCGRVIAADMPAAAAAAAAAAPQAGTATCCPASTGSSNSSSSSASASSAVPKRVAIKTALPPHHGVPWQHSRSLMVEARALRLAAHPAVIKLLGSCWSDELDALVFELLPGGDLQARMALPHPAAEAEADQQSTLPAAAAAAAADGKLQQQPLQQYRGTDSSRQQQQQQQQRVESNSKAACSKSCSKFLSWQQRLLISYQLASALASLHSSRPQQLLHRDMKPENVLLDDENNARLTDFGIATVVHCGEAAQQQQQQLQGSAAALKSRYSAPEGYNTSPKSPTAAASKACSWSLAAGGGAATPPKSPVAAAVCPWGAALQGAHTPLDAPAAQQQQQHGQSAAVTGHHHHHHQQQQQRHHGHSNVCSSAAEAVLARLAARGVGGTAAQGGGSSSSTGGAWPGSSRSSSSSSAAAAAAQAGAVVVVHHGWAGTHDYLDPMYEQLGQLCDKSDVYGLGLIMCQLIMDAPKDPKQAKRVLQHTAHEQKVLHLPAATADWLKENALTFGELALRCAAADRKQRLTAAQLATALHELVVEAANSSSDGGSGGTASSSSRGKVLCPAFVAVKQLLPGQSSFVPSCLHGAAAADPTSAAAAATQAHNCLVAAAAAVDNSSSSSSGGGGDSSVRAVKVGKAADASSAPNNRRSNAAGSHGSSCGSSIASCKKQTAEAAKVQAQQHAQKLQQLTRRIMSLELLLHPNGAITGGSITVTAPAAAAVSSTASAVAAAHPITPSPVVLRVLAGCYSASSGSIMFCCNSSKAAANAPAGGSSSHNSSSTGSSAGGTWYVFCGCYKNARLLGEWTVADATIAAAVEVARGTAWIQAGRGSKVPEALSLLRIASSGKDRMSGAAAVPAIAASYDWVMYHTCQQKDSSSDGSMTATDTCQAARVTTDCAVADESRGLLMLPANKM